MEREKIIVRDTEGHRDRGVWGQGGTENGVEGKWLRARVKKVCRDRVMRNDERNLVPASTSLWSSGKGSSGIKFAIAIGGVVCNV